MRNLCDVNRGQALTGSYSTKLQGNREWGSRRPTPPARGNRPPHVTPPVGTGHPTPPHPWEWAIGNGESGRKTSPHRTPPPFFHRRLPVLHHSPFPRFPIPDCPFPRVGWQGEEDSQGWDGVGWRGAASARCLAGLQQLGDESGPSRLMRGAQATAIVAIEVLVEQHVIAEVRIIRVRPMLQSGGTSSRGVRQEYARQPIGQLVGYRVEGHEPAGT